MVDAGAAEKEASNEQHAEVIKQLESLLESASQVQILKGKWLQIRNKITILKTHLSDISVSEMEFNPLSFDLMASISGTCSAASSLAVVCRSVAPMGGKLKTQSDVDSLSAELNAQINDLDVLMKTGVISETTSFSTAVVSSGKRDAIRAETRNLMTRLQIGSTESRSSALDSLLGLLQEDDKNVLIAVAQGIVPVLVHLLDSSFSHEIKEKTVTAIAKISSLDSSKHVLLCEGLVLLNDLMRVLESGSIFAKDKACIALRVLSTSKENARAIGSRGGISSLLEICQEGTPNSQALAAGVLRNLAIFEEIKENFLEEDALLLLLGLCNTGTTLAQENSIGCLNNLISGDDDLKLLVAKEGVIQSLKHFWDSCANSQNLEVAVQMVSTMVTCPKVAGLLIAEGFLSRMIGVLNSCFLGVRIAAAKGLCDLSYSSKTVKELGELGSIPLLVAMLDNKAIEEKKYAAKLLSIAMNCSGNRMIYRKQEPNVVTTVKMLDSSLDMMDKKYLVSVLASVVHHNKCRKIIISAGAFGYLQRLVDSDVEGAKKLLDGLRNSKPWRVFSKASSKQDTPP